MPRSKDSNLASQSSVVETADQIRLNMTRMSPDEMNHRRRLSALQLKHRLAETLAQAQHARDELEMDRRLRHFLVRTYAIGLLVLFAGIASGAGYVIALLVKDGSPESHRLLAAMLTAATTLLAVFARQFLEMATGKAK